jgi:hypothetical protein
MNLEDSMSVARDRARKTAKSKSNKNPRRSTKKAAKHTVNQMTCRLCDRRAAEFERKGMTTSDAEGAAQAEHMKAHPTAPTVPRESARTLGKKMVEKRAKTASAPVSVEGVRPVKVTVKQAVLDAFYADQRKVLSTKDAVAAIQASHSGMNESSIRVWISDFRKDGSIKLVRKDGREAFLKAGKLGQFALR